MALYTLNPFLDMFAMARGTLPGLHPMAVVAEIALRFHQTGRFRCVTTGAGHCCFAGSMFIVHGGPRQILGLMAERAIADLGRPGMIAEFRKGNHFGTVSRFAAAVMTLGA